jgi:cellobiose-specific phosphotransferase system component IIC
LDGDKPFILSTANDIDVNAFDIDDVIIFSNPKVINQTLASPSIRAPPVFFS